MMNYVFRPIERWPEEPTTDRRSRWTFKAGWSDTTRLLEYELGMLNVDRAVIQCAVDESQIRNDGMLRASAKPSFPGVILSFEIPGIGPVSYPCDSCELWQHNVRSIALALQALRAVDRYGVTRRSEQYKGWAKLPSPEAAADPVKDAKQLLARIVGDRWNPDDLYRMVRIAKSRTHPDAGGDKEQFQAVCDAALVLGV